MDEEVLFDETADPLLSRETVERIKTRLSNVHENPLDDKDSGDKEIINILRLQAENAQMANKILVTQIIQQQKDYDLAISEKFVRPVKKINESLQNVTVQKSAPFEEGNVWNEIARLFLESGDIIS